MMKMISIVSGCYNEQDNVDELCRRVAQVMAGLPYRYEHILIDNSSTDATVDRLKVIAARDKRVKIIVNARNFGHIRSPFHGVLQAKGDAVIAMASDLQDPPEMIPEFIAKWEAGYKAVMAVKPESDEASGLFFLRKLYYRVVNRITEVPLVPNATGFGLYDQKIIGIMRSLRDPYPYFRGLISEIGFPVATVLFRQPRRARGITKNNFYTLYDLAMLGIVNHSKVPLRLMIMAGFCLAMLCVIVALGYLAAKLLYWDSFQFGLAPMLIGMFFLGAIQIAFIGILGEYIAAIYTHVRQIPHVVELERINFEPDAVSPSAETREDAAV